MTYRETHILLPCHSLEDFPMHYDGEEADGLLAAWTAPWHPALLAATGATPRWRRGDNPPSDLRDLLILVPGVADRELPQGFAQRARDEGARLIHGNFTRDEILQQALEPLGEAARSMDPELVADFLALGYGYLQVELLTRQIRYSTSLDELHFNRQAVEGAQAAARGETETARQRLTACFNMLAQERDHYYAVDAYVVDIALLAPSTCGPELVSQLADAVPINLLLTADLLRTLAQVAPDSWAAVARGLQEGYVGLVGGDEFEERAPLHSCETVRRRLAHGLELFQQRLDTRPRVYGRRRYGLSVLHPQLLARMGFVGALHAALGEGQCPAGTRLKLRWEGPGRPGIDAIGRLPLDAARPSTFLGLASKLSETMDVDHVATICMAHWPGRVCPWYHDLRRVARYGAMLGKFVTVHEYFRETEYPGHTERFQADQYRSPYLQQAVSRQQPDPITTSVRYWRQHARATALESLEMLRATVRRTAPTQAAALIAEVDATADHTEAGDLPQRLETAWQQSLHDFANLLPRAAGQPDLGCLVVNPSSHVRRAMLDVTALPQLPEVASPVYAAAVEGDRKWAVVDVPPMGFAWLTASPVPTATRRAPRPLVEDLRLFNEFFEAHISPETGSLQNLYEYEQRGNRLSQQLAVRAPRDAAPDRRSPASYSTMVADSVRVTAAGPMRAAITSEGRLVGPQGETWATFRQQYRIGRGSRVLELEVELDTLAALSDHPWNSYCCCRFAWASESAMLWRGVNQMRERAEAKRLEAPSYIDIDDDGRHTTILTGGLPFHRRTGLRMLDTLLVVEGERERSFRLGIGVDLKYPLQESCDFLAPLAGDTLTAPPLAGPASSWLFHIDSRNVLATGWTPLLEAARVVGFRVRLLETAGRAAHAKIQSCYPIATATRQDFRGDSLGACPVEAGATRVDLNANEWIEVAARWGTAAREG